MVFEKLLGTDTYSTVLGESWCTLKLNRTTVKALNEELQGLTNVFVECPFVRIELNAHFSDAVNSFAEARGSSANAYFRFSAEIRTQVRSYHAKRFYIRRKLSKEKNFDISAAAKVKIKRA